MKRKRNEILNEIPPEFWEGGYQEILIDNCIITNGFTKPSGYTEYEIDMMLEEEALIEKMYADWKQREIDELAYADYVAARAAGYTHKRGCDVMDRTAFYYELTKLEQTRARGVSLSHFLAKKFPDRFFIDEKGYGRDRENPRFKIDNHRNYYYFNDGSGKCGNSIDFLMNEMQMTHPQAVRTLLAYDDEYPFG